MAYKTLAFMATALVVVALHPTITRADHDSEKHKIYEKYEIVSFGQTQSFVQTHLRILEGIGEYFGFDLDNKSVYEKRYESLKLHWDDVRKKFKENNVDTKKEPIYF